MNKLKQLQGEICSESELEIISTFGAELELSDFDSSTSEAANIEVKGGLVGLGFGKPFPFPKMVDTLSNNGRTPTVLGQRNLSPVSDSLGSFIVMDRVSSKASRVSFQSDLLDNASITSNSSQILSEEDLQQILAELSADSLNNLKRESPQPSSRTEIKGLDVSTDPVLDSLILPSPSTPTESSIYLESLDRKKLVFDLSKVKSPDPGKRFDPLEFLRDLFTKPSFQNFTAALKKNSIPNFHKWYVLLLNLQEFKKNEKIHGIPLVG